MSKPSAAVAAAYAVLDEALRARGAVRGIPKHEAVNDAFRALRLTVAADEESKRAAKKRKA